MKMIVALVMGMGLAACGPLDLSRSSVTMELARTYAGAGETCTTKLAWVECHTGLTPSAAAGGGE